jgi:Flp pilus assembly protein TadD
LDQSAGCQTGERRKRTLNYAGSCLKIVDNFRGGDLDKAIDSFKKAIALDPRNDEDFVWLAIAYRKKGDSESAKAAISQAFQLNRCSVFALRVNSGATE